MLGKNQAKILFRYYEQCLSTFKSSYNIHNPQYCFTLVSFVVKSFFSGSSCAETLLRQKPLIPAPFY